ncbi:MAG: DUF4157 domain-containing protein [Ignavibacteriales bacterium]
MKAVLQKASENHKHQININRRRSAERAPPSSLSSSNNNVSNQRSPSCPCGGGCPRCDENDKKVLQTKKTSGHASLSQGQDVPPIVQEVLRSPGHPLDFTTRAFMESRFGHDFSQVRVHTDEKAADSAQAVNALAYTAGQKIVFNKGRFLPTAPTGQRLLAHELTHVVQQDGQANGLQASLQVGSPDDSAERQANRAAESIMQDLPVPRIQPAQPDIIRRDDFTPWPGQIGTDVPLTRTQKGSVVSERIQRTGSPAYASSKPILLEFDSSKCSLTSTMEINFIKPKDKAAQLSDDRFTNLKNRILEVANDKLNGWMEIKVGDNPSCDVCRGKTITINVVALEGSSTDADTVELRKGTGRANAGQIFEGGDNWFTALLGGVSNGTLWHEMGHVVLGLPDEYTNEPGDPPRPEDKINESDWSVMASHTAFGRRAVMHPRHFSFMTAWLGRRFPDCTFELVALPRPIVIDIVTGFDFSFGSKGGKFALLYTIDLASSIPLDKKRHLHLLVGGYASILARADIESQHAFLVGALVGLDYSTNRSKGGFGIRADMRAGGTYFTSGVPDLEKEKFLPTLAGTLTLGYVGPKVDIGLTGSAVKIFSESQKDNPFFMLGLRSAITW